MQGWRGVKWQVVMRTGRRESGCSKSRGRGSPWAATWSPSVGLAPRPGPCACPPRRAGEATVHEGPHAPVARARCRTAGALALLALPAWSLLAGRGLLRGGAWASGSSDSVRFCLDPPSGVVDGLDSTRLERGKLSERRDKGDLVAGPGRGRRERVRRCCWVFAVVPWVERGVFM